MTILITGGDGYIGWPTALRTARRTDDRIVLVDNFARREWVEDVGSVSATPVADMDKRLEAARDIHDAHNLSFVEADLTDRAVVDELLAVHEPDTVIHTAAQPSAPYSQINGERASYTQHNNLQATRNLLWGLHENDLGDTHFVETTTTGVYGCYDDQTEILTRQGWKLFGDLEDGDRVLTRDTDSRIARYEKPTEIHQYPFEGQLYRQQNQSLDFCITPNHRVFTQTVNTNKSGDDRYGGLRERTVEEVEGKQVVYDTGFDWDGESRDSFMIPATDETASVDVPVESWLRFFGWYIAEGYVKQRKDRPSNYRVGFSQNKESVWVTDLEHALTEVADTLGIGVEKREEDTVFRYELFSKQLASYLDRFGRSREKSIPAEIKQLDSCLLNVLLSALIKGDGEVRSEDRESMRYFTGSERLADDVQEIALKCGYASVVSYQSEYDRYVVSITEGPRVHVNHRDQTDEFVDYSGTVWCVTVPGDGIVFVRRNGKPVWSGNSPDFHIPEGGAVMENQGERDEVPFPAMGGSWYHQCYDDKTEVLSKNGWKSFPTLTKEDNVMAMDFETGDTGWTSPSEVQTYDYTGEMVTVSNRRLDLKVTPNHRMLIGTSWSQGGQETFENRRKIVEADKLGREYQHPCFFASFPDWDGKARETFELPACDREVNQIKMIRLESREIQLDSWLRFFGWWLTEGSVGKALQTNNVRIYQSNADEFVDLFKDIGFDDGKIRHHVDSKQEYIELSDHQLATYLRQFSDEKYIPAWIRNLPRERLETIFEALIEGDGTRNHRGWTFYTSSPKLADHVQEIALKLGYGATTQSLDRSGEDNFQQKPEYRVGISPTWCLQTNQGGDAFGREHYDGKVYCCTVDGGLVLVRRNGQPVWCGNSKSHDAANMRLAHQQFGVPISDVRTAIVYGTEIEETREDDRLKTRFDFDYYFGTVAHRFCAQAVAGYPVTVYGKGEQRKPFVSLDDTAEGLAQLAVMDPDDRPDDHVVYNQVTRAISIVEIATTIADVGTEYDLDVAVEHFENPRDEDETHKMEIEKDRYNELIDGQSVTFEEGVRDIFETLVRYQETIEAHEDRFLPGVLEE